jgi:hypothetical protein
MSTSGRRGLSDDQQAEVWQRWKTGESLSEIGLALGKLACIHWTLTSLKTGILLEFMSVQKGLD